MTHGGPRRLTVIVVLHVHAFAERINIMTERQVLFSVALIALSCGQATEDATFYSQWIDRWQDNPLVIASSETITDEAASELVSMVRQDLDGPRRFAFSDVATHIIQDEVVFVLGRLTADLLAGDAFATDVVFLLPKLDDVGSLRLRLDSQLFLYERSPDGSMVILEAYAVQTVGRNVVQPFGNWSQVSLLMT